MNRLFKLRVLLFFVKSPSFPVKSPQNTANFVTNVKNLRLFTNKLFLIFTVKNNRLLQHPGIQLLHRAQRRELQLQLVSFLAMLALGIICCCFAWHNNALITIAGLTFTVLSLTALYHLYQHWHDDRLMRILVHHPQQIVWIYTVVVQRMPFGVHLFQSGTIFFKLADGSEISVILPENKLRLVCHTLGRLLPHATIGYSKELETQYQKNPASLLRKTD